MSIRVTLRNSLLTPAFLFYILSAVGFGFGQTAGGTDNPTNLKTIRSAADVKLAELTSEKIGKIAKTTERRNLDRRLENLISAHLKSQGQALRFTDKNYESR